MTEHTHPPTHTHTSSRHEETRHPEREIRKTPVLFPPPRARLHAPRTSKPFQSNPNPTLPHNTTYPGREAALLAHRAVVLGAARVVVEEAPHGAAAGVVAAPPAPGSRCLDVIDRGLEVLTLAVRAAPRLLRPRLRRRRRLLRRRLPPLLRRRLPLLRRRGRRRAAVTAAHPEARAAGRDGNLLLHVLLHALLRGVLRHPAARRVHEVDQHRRLGAAGAWRGREHDAAGLAAGADDVEARRRYRLKGTPVSGRCCLGAARGADGLRACGRGKTVGEAHEQ